MTRIGKALCFAAFLALVFFQGPLGAQAKRRSKAREGRLSKKAQKKKARRLFARGQRLYKRGKYEEAAKAFEAAYELWAYRAILFNIALAHAMAENRFKAAVNLHKYLKDASQKEMDSLPEVLKKLRREAGVLIIVTPSKEAKIYVDGRMVGVGRADLVVKPGARAVDIRVKDKVVASKMVKVKGGGEKTWELAQIPRPAARKGGPRVAPRKAEPTPQPVVKKESPLAKLHWAYFASACGVTVAALAGAIATHMKSSQYKDDFEKDRSNESLRDKGITYFWVSRSLWGVTAAAAAGSVALAIFTRWSSSSKESPTKGPQVTLTPGPTPAGAGLTVRW